MTDMVGVLGWEADVSATIGGKMATVKVLVLAETAQEALELVTPAAHASLAQQTELDAFHGSPVLHDMQVTGLRNVGTVFRRGISDLHADMYERDLELLQERLQAYETV